MNLVVLIGRLTRDPEIKYLANTGTPVATFSLAIDKQLSKEKRQELAEKGEPTADFINIVVWGKQAENCANYLAKGRLVAIQGRVQSRSWETENGRRYVTEVVANQVQFLEWGKDNDIPDGFIEVNLESENIPF
jgi:single-strand DNA-binding protein